MKISPYDYSKLNRRVKEFGYTQESLAKEIGISPASLNQKLNNKSLFRQDEIMRLGQVLNIPSKQLHLYFFKHEL